MPDILHNRLRDSPRTMVTANRFVVRGASFEQTPAVSEESTEWSRPLRLAIEGDDYEAVVHGQLIGSGWSVAHLAATGAISAAQNIQGGALVRPGIHSGAIKNLSWDLSMPGNEDYRALLCSSGLSGTTALRVFQLEAEQAELLSSFCFAGASFDATTLTTSFRAAEGNEERELEITFESLLEQWRKERPEADSGTGIFSHIAYQQLIGLGAAVVPLILRDLENSGEDWFWALKSITREDPVPEEHRGNYQLMREYWLAWGRRQGLI